MKKSDRAKSLLASAVKTLTSGQSSFSIQPWRTILNTQTRTQATPVSPAPIIPVVARSGRRATDNIVVPVTALPSLPQDKPTMTKANATAKNKEFKAAAKSAAGRGITPPAKHVPATPEASTQGVDTPPSDMIKSGFSVFNRQPPGDSTMSKTPATTKPAAAAPKVEQSAETRAASDALIKADLAKREQAKKEAADAKAKASAEKAEKLRVATEAREAEALERKARAEERSKQAAMTKEQREARQAELVAAGKTYTGSMLALADRVKAGVYVKSMTGQLRSNDELAQALDAVPAENVVKLGMLVFGEANKYAALNIGQQSMNYRNRMRGAVKNGKVKLGDDVVTLDLIKKLRDDNGFATGEAMAAEKAKAAEAREAKKKADAEAKAKKDQEVIAAKAKREEDAKAAAEVKAKEAEAKKVAAEKAKTAKPAAAAPASAPAAA